jgi:transposase, IS5 family
MADSITRRAPTPSDSASLDPVAVDPAANVNDLNMAGALLHGAEEAAFGDAGYQGVHKRPEATGPTWHVAMRPGKRRKLNPSIEPDFVVERAEKMKASA